jgi:hypothetical protein
LWIKKQSALLSSFTSFLIGWQHFEIGALALTLVLVYRILNGDQNNWSIKTIILNLSSVAFGYIFMIITQSQFLQVNDNRVSEGFHNFKYTSGLMFEFLPVILFSILPLPIILILKEFDAHVRRFLYVYLLALGVGLFVIDQTRVILFITLLLTLLFIEDKGIGKLPNGRAKYLPKRILLIAALSPWVFVWQEPRFSTTPYLLGFVLDVIFPNQLTANPGWPEILMIPFD